MKAALVICECGVFVGGGIPLCESKDINVTEQAKTQPWATVFDFHYIWRQDLLLLFTV